MTGALGPTIAKCSTAFSSCCARISMPQILEYDNASVDQK